MAWINVNKNRKSEWVRQREQVDALEWTRFYWWSFGLTLTLQKFLEKQFWAWLMISSVFTAHMLWNDHGHKSSSSKHVLHRFCLFIVRNLVNLKFSPQKLKSWLHWNPPYCRYTRYVHLIINEWHNMHSICWSTQFIFKKWSDARVRAHTHTENIKIQLMMYLFPLFIRVHHYILYSLFLSIYTYI